MEMFHKFAADVISSLRKSAQGIDWSDALYSLKQPHQNQINKANAVLEKNFQLYLRKLGAVLKPFKVSIQSRGSYIDSEMHGSDGLRLQGRIEFDLTHFEDPKGRSFQTVMQDEFQVWGIHRNIWDFGE